jgi:hypothetical protein
VGIPSELSDCWANYCAHQDARSASPFSEIVFLKQIERG